MSATKNYIDELMNLVLDVLEMENPEPDDFELEEDINGLEEMNRLFADEELQVDLRNRY